MSYSPILILHISAGTVGFLSGAVAISLRKGSRRHALAGDVFVVTMLTMAASGAYMALMKSQMGNFLGGVFTFYLVATAWWTARRTDRKTDSADWIALLCVLAVVIGNLIYGIEAARSATGRAGGYPAPIYFFGGGVALMLFVASGSIFLARAHLFPVALRKTGILVLVSFMPLILMIFWLVRVRLVPKFRKKALPRAAPSFALHT
jgi:uncharacterized membrane protein